MNNIKRLGIVIVVVAVAALVGGSFGGSEILDRAIIVGMGIDATDKEEELKVTAEIISPGNGSEQVGTFSKTITVTAESIADAIKAIAENVGKEASLGQCIIIVFGEKYYSERNLFDVIDYLINSDSFRESAVVCCCEGPAEQLMNNGDALSQSVSLALSAKLLDQTKKVGIASNNLLDFTRSQRELSKAGYLNLVRFKMSENTDQNDPEKKQGYFSYNEIAVFKNNSYVCKLSETESKAFSVFDKKALGGSFVSDATGKKITLNVNDKKVTKKYVNGEVSIEIKLSVNLSRTDSANESGSFTYKESKNVAKENLDDVKKQVEKIVSEFLQRQITENFDIAGLHEAIRQKEGSSRELEDLPVEDISVKFSVSVEEK